MTIEKLDNDYTSLGIIRNKINGIIDHLNSKEVFPDTGKMIESKQELIPLDMERICDEIRSIATPKTWKDVSPNNQLKTILSKYRVSPTPPVTSTIEEQINQIENIIRNGGWAYGLDEQKAMTETITNKKGEFVSADHGEYVSVLRGHIDAINTNNPNMEVENDQLFGDETPIVDGIKAKQQEDNDIMPF